LRGQALGQGEAHVRVVVNEARGAEGNDVRLGRDSVEIAPLGGRLFAWRLTRPAMIEGARGFAERLAACSQLGEGLVRVKGGSPRPARGRPWRCGTDEVRLTNRP
jgi:hypothetical protein